MKTKLFLFMAIATIALSSCKKDLASDWEGTYNGTSSSSAITRVVITTVDKTTIKIALQTPTFVGYLTYATIGNGKLTNATTVTINEDGTLANNPNDTYKFTGVGTRNGNSITISGQAVNKNNSSDVQYVAFAGNK